MALQLDKILNNPAIKPFNNLTNLVDLASTAGEMFVVAPEKIENQVYLFDTRGEEEVSLESDITDNWVEDNKTMQDHIGLKPMTITLSGYVGELTNKLPDVFPEALSRVPDQLSGISAFMPKLTTQTQYILNRTQEVYGIYEKANRTVKTGYNRIEALKDGVEVPKEVPNQQKVFAQFYDLWQQRGLYTVYTPFGVYNNMAIQALRARQEEDSSYISEFSVTFKQIRIAGQMWQYNDPAKLAEITKQTLSPQIDKGIKMPLVSTLKEGKDWATNILWGNK